VYNKKRFFKPKDNDSLNSMIKKTSMNAKRQKSDEKKLLVTIVISSILLGATITIGLGFW